MGFTGDTLARPDTPTRHERHPSPGETVPSTNAWVPIRTLAERHRVRALQHLLSLGESDRYLRFGYPASDEQIGRYVEAIDFDRDEVFGIFNRRLELIALAHLAYSPESNGQAAAEFGVSVAGKARGRGFGARLFEHAALHARNRGVDTLIIHALSENLAMLRIARNAGATVERTGAESQARLKLPPEDLLSRMGAIVEDQAAELDYRWKVHARRVDDWLRTLARSDA